MENTNTTASTGNKPEKKFRAGAISATVWQNQGKDREGNPATYRTISLARNYKDKKTGEWKSTNSFRILDLPKVALVSNKAFEYLVMSDENAKAGEGAPNDDAYIEEEIVM